MRPAPIGLLGTLRSWFAAEAKEMRPPAQERARSAPRPPPHSYGAVRVLVADDNPVNLMVVAALLESRGLFPLLAADGAEAVALACEMPFDLILMDLQMPILDGLSATAAIRRFEHAAGRPAVPVVAYSSALPAAAVLAAYGINDSLVKPCEDQDLEDCLVHWCPIYRAAPSHGGCARAQAGPARSPLEAGVGRPAHL